MTLCSIKNFPASPTFYIFAFSKKSTNGHYHYNQQHRQILALLSDLLRHLYVDAGFHESMVLGSHAVYAHLPGFGAGVYVTQVTLRVPSLSNKKPFNLSKCCGLNGFFIGLTSQNLSGS